MPSPRRSRKRELRPFKQIEFFDPKEFLANAGIGRTIQRYGPKQAIFSQGKPADSVYYIQEGRVRLSVGSKQGKEATIALLGPGDFLGEGCIASDQSVRMASATAITVCAVLKIERKEMLRTLHEEHKFSDLFVAYLVQRHNHTQADLVDQLFNSSEKRLARAEQAFREYRRTNSTERSELLHAVAELLFQEKKSFAETITLEMGKLFHDSGGNDWDNPLTREFLHEQIQEARIH